MSTKLCPNCKKETKNPKFCSKSCAASINNKIAIKRKRIQRTCSLCKTNIDTKRKFCKDCLPRVDWSQITMGQAKSKRAYQRHSRIRDLARVLFRKHNINPKCRVCNYSKHIEVCHIKAIKDFEDNISISEINKLDNLIGLCPNCHWEFDNNFLSLNDIPPPPI